MFFFCEVIISLKKKYTLKKRWDISTQIWVKYGQTQMLG